MSIREGAGCFPEALVECIRASNEETELIVVPKQLTLETEQLVLSGLKLKGSFRIQVMSAERFARGFLMLRAFRTARGSTIAGG